MAEFCARKFFVHGENLSVIKLEQHWQELAQAILTHDVEDLLNELHNALQFGVFEWLRESSPFFRLKEFLPIGSGMFSKPRFEFGVIRMLFQSLEHLAPSF